MTINLGPLAFQALHVLLLGVFAAALLAGNWAGRKQQVKVSQTLFDMAFAALVAGRIGFVILWLEQYWDAPLTMFDIRDGGFSPWAAAVAVIGVGCWRLWRRPQLREPLVVALLAGVTVGLIGGMPTLLRMGDAQAVPPIVLHTADGAALPLDKMAQGRPMVVNLWATWCPPCRREMPVLAAAQRRSDAIMFVLVNQGEDAQTVSTYLNREHMGLRNVLLDPAKSIGLAVGSTALPTTLFYNSAGTLVERHLGPLSAASLEAKLAKIRTSDASSQR